MNEKQIEAVTKLPAPKRYAHTIKTIADKERAWGLYSDGWALFSTDDGKPVFPIWPEREYAALLAHADWAEFSPRAIEIDELLEEFLPGFKEGETLLGIFPTPEQRGVIPAITVFEEDLRTELSRYE